MTDIELIIEPRSRDLGGFQVGRVLPFAKRRTVGPFIFFDVIGPAVFKPGKGIDVRPHPHIGLATVTYLFSGELRHRDSLGSDQIIRPGDVNWMTAGRGITHSERTDDASRENGQTMHGIQSWVALPETAEETEPAFHHHPKTTLPVSEQNGVVMRVIAGSAYGMTSPVKTFSPMFYVAVEASKNATLTLPPEYEERSLFIVEGEITIDGKKYANGQMLVFTANANPNIRMTPGTKLILLGGAPIGPRIIWWNLVATTREKIDQAKEHWRISAENGFKNSYFSLPPGENEFIPSPED